MGQHDTIFFNRIWLLATFVFVITAWFSVGFHHPDEHFQIIEFTNYKLGNVPVDVLPWEYNAQIRPGLQVIMAYGLFQTLNFCGLSDPFLQVFVLRLMVALFAVFVIGKCCSLFDDEFTTDKGRRVFWLCSFFLWFVPYLSVRFSSENLAGLLLLYAIYLLVKNQRTDQKLSYMVLVGILLGFAFYARFQIGFAMIGLGLWLLIMNKPKMKALLWLIIGLIVAFGINLLIDYWLYQDWVLTPYNYLIVNVVQDVASNWGISPWWFYFDAFVFIAVPPLSIILLCFFVPGIYKALAHPFTWCFVPFILLHIFVGHKELRFIFPMLFMFVYFCARGFDVWLSKDQRKYLIRTVIVLVLLVNIPLFLFRVFAPARELVNYNEFLYDYAQDKKVILLSTESNIYTIAALEMNFYKTPNVRSYVFPAPDEMKLFIEDERPEIFLAREEIGEAENQYQHYSRTILFSVLPEWVLKISWNNWQDKARLWNIVEYRRL